MKNKIGMGLVLAVGLLSSGSMALATDPISDALTAQTATFALVVTLAVAVTSFFIGRSWLRRVK